MKALRIKGFGQSDQAMAGREEFKYLKRPRLNNAKNLSNRKLNDNAHYPVELPY